MDYCPKAYCLSCGRRYSGWNLAQRESCDCGGKLIINHLYGAIIGYIKHGNKLPAKEEENNNEEG